MYQTVLVIVMKVTQVQDQDLQVKRIVMMMFVVVDQMKNVLNVRIFVVVDQMKNVLNVKTFVVVLRMKNAHNAPLTLMGLKILMMILKTILKMTLKRTKKI
jgi:hypothetical protein